MGVLLGMLAGTVAAIPSAFYTALCVFTASLALPLRRRRDACPAMQPLSE